MAKWPAARSAEVSQPTTAIIAALGQTLISSVARRFATIARFAPTSWKQPYGIRSKPCWTTPSVLQGNTSGVSQRPGDGKAGGKTRPPWIGKLASCVVGSTVLIDSYAEEIIEADEFKPRLAGLKQRLARLQADRDTAIAADEAERSLHLVIGRLADFARYGRTWVMAD